MEVATLKKWMFRIIFPKGKVFSFKLRRRAMVEDPSVP
jgi:hypothetical protein